MPESKQAIVMRSTGSSYTLRDAASGEMVEAGIRGRLRLKGVRTTNPVAVGDVVEYETDALGESLITQIHPRRNYIIRRSPNLSKEAHIIAANVDQAALVVTLLQPETAPEFIDRFLVTCEAYGIPAALILNKIDLLDGYQEAIEAFRETYSPAGYPVIGVSGTTGENMEELEAFLKGKTTLFSGNSGVGKSTLLRRIDPGADVKIAPISQAHHKGRHTTTHARMYPLGADTYIIDTPGVKGFGLVDIDPAELYRYFPEMMRASKDCQYYNCTHVHEPGCEVQKAVEEGLISESRYISYLKILQEDEKYRK